MTVDLTPRQCNEGQRRTRACPEAMEGSGTRFTCDNGYWKQISYDCKLITDCNRSNLFQNSPSQNPQFCLPNTSPRF